MAEFPALPLWTDSYLADTLHLSNAEHGVYLKLLMFAWRSPCCSLPDDDTRLARIAGLSGKAWATMKPVILAFWTEEDGRYVQKRLTREREFVERQRARQSAAGKASAKARALKKHDSDSTTVATAGQPKGNPHTHTHKESPQTPLRESAPPRKNGTRLSADWQPCEKAVAFARQEGMTDEQISRTADHFRDYWVARAGKEAVKRDWLATWRNWVRREDTRSSAGRSGRDVAQGRRTQREIKQDFARAARNVLDRADGAAAARDAGGGGDGADAAGGGGEDAGRHGAGDHDGDLRRGPDGVYRAGASRGLPSVASGAEVLAHDIGVDRVHEAPLLRAAAE